MTNCKKLRTDPYWTPNNYDLEFDSNLIPTNIPIENGRNLEKRLQKLMPLGKIIHVKHDSSTRPHDNGIRIHSQLQIKSNGSLITKVKL